MEVLRRGDSVKVGGATSVDRVIREVGSNMDNFLVSSPFSDRVAEIGGIELDDCPKPPGCSPLPSELPETEACRSNGMARCRVCTRTSGVCVPG